MGLLNDGGLHYSSQERPNEGFNLPAPKRRAMVNQRANRYRGMNQ